MTRLDLPGRRLHTQRIATHAFERPEQIVAWLGAVQAQDYLGGLWAIGLRMDGATEPEIERALDERTIVRTWPMRGTLHFVAADDARWMTALMAPRVVARNAGRLQRAYGVDAEVVAGVVADLETVAGDHQASYTYTADQRVATITIKNLAANGVLNQTHVWTFTYTKYASGLVQTMIVDGPQVGTGDKITYSYSAAGDLVSVTNTHGHTTSFSLYNAPM